MYIKWAEILFIVASTGNLNVASCFPTHHTPSDTASHPLNQARQPALQEASKDLEQPILFPRSGLVRRVVPETSAIAIRKQTPPAPIANSQAKKFPADADGVVALRSGSKSDDTPHFGQAVVDEATTREMKNPKVVQYARDVIQIVSKKGISDSSTWAMYWFRNQFALIRHLRAKHRDKSEEDVEKIIDKAREDQLEDLKLWIPKMGLDPIYERMLERAGVKARAGPGEEPIIHFVGPDWVEPLPGA